MSTALLEFHIASSSNTKRFQPPHVSTVQLRIRGKAVLKELQTLDWSTFEDAILAIHPTPVLEIAVEHRGGGDSAVQIFKWLLDAVPKGAILKRARSEGKLKLQFAVADGRKEWDLWTYTDSRDVLSAPSEYKIGEEKVTLAPPDVFGLMLCEEENRDKYLDIVRSTSTGNTVEENLCQST